MDLLYLNTKVDFLHLYFRDINYGWWHTILNSQLRMNECYKTIIGKKSLTTYKMYSLSKKKTIETISFSKFQ